MKHDPFEQKLEALARLARPADPTAAWKADILSTARRAAGGTGDAQAPAGTAPGRRLPVPRWLLITWFAAWALIAWMRLTMPAETEVAPASQDVLATARAEGASPAWETVHGGTAPLTLLAFHREMNSHTDTP